MYDAENFELKSSRVKSHLNFQFTRHDNIKKCFLRLRLPILVIKYVVGSMDRESSQQLQMWFSENFFAPKLAA